MEFINTIKIMKVRFWGTRGSIPSPGKETIKYGGNTTCLEVSLNSGRKIIIDAGSGIRALSQKVISQGITHIDLFLTHSHWDHIQGFPFFAPIYIPNFSMKIYAASPTFERLPNILEGQMKYIYYPVPFKEIGATIEFGKVKKSGISLDGVKISSIRTNHPLETHAFKLSEGGKTFVFMTDNELDNPDIAIVPYEELLNFVKNSDVLVHDAQYTKEEIEQYKGWGHSSWQETVSFAKKGNVKRLYITHYSPSRKDEETDKIVERADELGGVGLIVRGAREEEEFEV